MIRLIVIALVFYPSLVLADIDNGEMEIAKIDDGVYLHTSYKYLNGYGNYPSNGLVIVDGTDAYIIDTPWLEADTGVLVDWIDQSGYHLKASIHTHSHEDRSSGIGYLNSRQVPTYASSATNLILESKGLEKADFSFNGSMFVLLDDQIHAHFPGAGHSSDNLVVWLPKTPILFGGCLTRSLQSTSMGNISDASIGAWPHTMETLIVRYPDIELVVPGHGAVGGAELLSHTLELTMNASAEASGD